MTDDLSFNFEGAKSATPSAESAIAPFAPPPWPRNAADVLAVGLELNRIRDELRGGFKQWLQTNCQYSARSAFGWMKVAREHQAGGGEQVESSINAAELIPTEFGSAELPQHEINNLALVALEGFQTRKDCEGLDRITSASRMTAFFIQAAVNSPDATFAELRLALARANCVHALVGMQLRALQQLLTAQPEDGVIGSTPLAKQIVKDVCAKLDQQEPRENVASGLDTKTDAEDTRDF